jgi:rhodanese-related sulfurtransferase
MLTLLFIATLAMSFWIARHIWPVHGLVKVSSLDGMEAKGNNRTLKLLDVRDASEYLAGHEPGSINISIGRLPYVWQSDLSPDDDVVILSKKAYHRNKAVRTLRKRGFRHLYAWNAIIAEQSRVDDPQNMRKVEHGIKHIFEQVCK